MAWALVGEDNWGVTARMSVDFRRPVEVGMPIRAEGWITRSRRRIVDTAGHIVDAATGAELATATGVYVAASPDRKRDLRERYAYRPSPSATPPTPSERRDRRPRPAARRPNAPSPSWPPTARRPRRLGADLAEFTNDPDGFATALTAGLRSLADPEYLAGQQRVAPGIGPVHGVRWPLLAAVERGFRNVTRKDRPTPLLFVADRLFREPELEARWFAFGLLERTLAIETERTWQLLRRAAREAGDWITVDSLAHPYGKGIAAEPYRWAELELLVYSPSRWERRLVGSTIATMTHVDRKRGRDATVAAHALPLLGALMGDAEPDVQKALAWAYRSLTVVDRDGDRGSPPRRDRARRRAPTTATAPGSSATPSPSSTPPRPTSSGPASPASASAQAPRPPRPPSETAARFGGLPDPTAYPEPPL